MKSIPLPFPVAPFIRCILFADDTNGFASSKKKEELYRIMNIELAKLSKWFAHNKLTLNYEKLEYIDFSKPASTTHDPLLSLQIDGKKIKEVSESKFLGVYIDKNVSWRGHINKIISKLSQTVGIIGRARGFMQGPELLQLYNTMVLPHLQYCLINWGNFKGDNNVKLRDKLLGLQKTFLRIITGSHRLSHTDPLFAKLQTLKIDDLYHQSVRMFSYHLFQETLPGGISPIFEKANHSHATRGTKNNIFVSNSDTRSMKHIAPKTWNSLPLDLKRCPSIASFKNNSKMELIRPYAKFACSQKPCRSCPV